MALFRKKKKDIPNKAKVAYVKYFNQMRKAGKQPMTLANWYKSGRTSTYFRGTERTRPEAHFDRPERKRLGMKD